VQTSGMWRSGISALFCLALVVTTTGCAADPGSGPSRVGNTVAIGVDLPFAADPDGAAKETWNAMNLYLERAGGMAGPHKVELIQYDNSPPPNASWTTAECIRNAGNHVANRREVAVIGTRFSGCSKAQVPILNRAADGPMLMVSHTDTNPGLTKTWDTGEPAMYGPSGQRSYARVITTDDMQGVAAAQFAARDLGVRTCFVLNDGGTYGVGLAKSFTAEAVRLGIQIVGEATWQRESEHYRDLFGKAAGADCVYFGGIYDNHGDQLIKDKVAVLGDNNAVMLLAPDGFLGYPDFVQRPEAAGVYLTYTGLGMEGLVTSGNDSLAHFLAGYQSRYGENPESPFAIYGVQALQVVLAAIERSDGTRRDVWVKVFGGAGITIAADNAILGKPVSIDPASGDVSARDISIAVVKDGEETIVKALTTS